MKKTLTNLLTALVLGAVSLSASAGPVPYPNAGVLNPISYTFTAASTGNVVAYFWGSTAGYTSTISLLVNGVDTGISGLNNHSSTYGQVLNFGSVNAGDNLVFRLNVSDIAASWYSDAVLNSDQINHVYATDFSGDAFIPAGTFVSFEDLVGGGDLNYNDEDFVFTNVATAVPEPETLVLLGAGLLGVAASRRRKSK